MKLGQNRLNVRCWKLVVVFLLGLGTCVWGGCEKRDKVIKTPEVSLNNASASNDASGELAGQSSGDADREQVPGAERLLEVEAWPGQGEMLTFQLTWLGGEEEVVLRERPDENSAEVARRSWEDGSDVDWEETRVVVLAVRPFRALKDVRLEVMPFDPQAEVLEPEEMVEENVVVTVSQGELIELYQYVGEETCYLGIGGQMYVGDCPGKEFETAVAVEEGQRRLTPLEQEWWVLVGDGEARGWVRADNSLFEAHTRRMEAYE